MNHDLLDQSGFCQLLRNGLDVLGRVVGALVGSSKDDVRRGVTLCEQKLSEKDNQRKESRGTNSRLYDRTQTLLSDRQD